MTTHGTIKVYYNQNLRMSPEKLSAQVAHAVCRMNQDCAPPSRIIVLGVRAAKFKALCTVNVDNAHYIHYDLGLTEIEAGTPTVLAIEG